MPSHISVTTHATAATSVVATSGYFVGATHQSVAEINARQVICPKSTCGVLGSRDYTHHQEAATKALPHVFARAKHFHAKNAEGESSNKYANLQLEYAGNLAKIKNFKCHLDLKIHNNTEVERIKGGSDIKGTGTFKFHIKDDEGGVHLIEIPNCKYVPDLKVGLLSPHHWAQEAKDHYPVPKGTKTNTDDEALMLIWKQQRHQWIIPYHPLTNTPSFHTAPASCTYPAFVALYEAAEVQYHHREHVLQMPGRLHLDKEFTAEENVHADILKKLPLASEGATSNNVMGPWGHSPLTSIPSLRKTSTST